MKPRHTQPQCGWTLLELTIALIIVAFLIVLSTAALKSAWISGAAAASTSNLHQLAVANMTYAADHEGYFCPAQNPANTIRWHGARSSSGGTFDPTKGYLAPYLGESGRVKKCPLLRFVITGAGSFENGTGGYGYNATYIGGTPSNIYQPVNIRRLVHPSAVVMFTTTAFASGKSVQEYPYCEPFEWVDPNYELAGSLQPSVHFRAHGKALVAWCDGHVTAEHPSRLGGTDYYGGNSKKQMIGWFGPSNDNGYWNPDFQP